MKKILNTMMFLSIIVEVLLVAQPVFAQVTVTGVNDLGTLGGADSIATGINNAGWVVGESVTSSGAQHPFLWTAQGGMVDLGTLSGTDISYTYSSATGINDLGQVVGDSPTASGASHAFLWTAQGGMVDLGALRDTYSGATAINNVGQVVGYSAQHAFLWTAQGGMVDLGTLGGADSAAYGINDIGQVVGTSATASGASHAFLWTAQGGMVDLGTLGGTYSIAFGINNAGQVVGDSLTASGVPHAFLWTMQGGMVDLGTLGGTNSAAFGINDFGNIVGSSKTATDSCYNGHAFLRTAQDGMVDLGTLGGSCSSASGINGLGQVAGWSFTPSGAEHATLWTVSLTPRFSLTATKDFRFTDVNFTAIPAQLGTLLPQNSSKYNVTYVTKQMDGTVLNTYPGQLYGVIIVNGTGLANATINDIFGATSGTNPFIVNPAHLDGGVEVLRVNTTGNALVITDTQVTSANINNTAGTVNLTINLTTPLANDEKLMIYIKFQTQLFGLQPNFNDFVNNALVAANSANGTASQTASATINFFVK